VSHPSGMTDSERLVFDLCSKSFLSLWAYASPRRPDGRELCDALIVFGNAVVVFSVKEIIPSATAETDVAFQRWTKKAVDDSVKQLGGANRELKSMQQVVRHDGSPGVSLPALGDRRVHFVAVAAGANRKFPIAAGRQGFGYIHVLDEFSLRALMDELDTASDFLRYLHDKEAFRGAMVLHGGEENLLGTYLHQNRTLPDVDHLVIDDDVWTKVKSQPEFVARKAEDRISYGWDRLIEGLLSDLTVALEAGHSLSDYELAVRTMATEDRFARRCLSSAFLDWLHKRQLGARNLQSPSGVGYVFSIYPRHGDREQRRKDLEVRCLAARSPSVLNVERVIGIATELYDPSGYSLDVVYLHLPSWSEEDERHLQDARSKLGILQSPERRWLSVSEFPEPSVGVTRGLGAPSAKKRPSKRRRTGAKKKR